MRVVTAGAKSKVNILVNAIVYSVKGDPLNPYPPPPPGRRLYGLYGVEDHDAEQRSRRLYSSLSAAIRASATAATDIVLAA